MKNKYLNEDKYLDWVLNTWHWPFQRINSNGKKEFSCPHGIGHGGIHGCDGCCRHKSFKRELKNKIKQYKGKKKEII